MVIFNLSMDVSAKYLCRAFYTNQLARLRSVSLVPEKNQSWTAYLLVEEWMDTEGAYHFIQRLKTHQEARLVHHLDEAWTIYPLKKKHLATRAGGIRRMTTTHINQTYYEKLAKKHGSSLLLRVRVREETALRTIYKNKELTFAPKVDNITLRPHQKHFKNYY